MPLMQQNNKQSLNIGFTIVEILVVAPVVLLVIVIFIGAIVSMTGDVLSTRAANVLAYDIQDSLNKIEQDVKLSGGYLATNSVTITSPQGYNNDTTNFNNVDITNGSALILNTYATTVNPLDPNRGLVYLSGQPNACNSNQVNQNQPLMLNIIYFIKANTLWRRIVTPANVESIGCIGGVIGIPWQQPSCAPSISGAICKTIDQKLIDGVQLDSLNIEYYTNTVSPTVITEATNVSLSNTDRLTALKTAGSVKITINAAKTVAGRSISQSGSIRASSLNNNNN